MNRTEKSSDNEARAAAWLVTLDADPSAQTTASWQRWVGESARHQAAFVRLQRSWRRMDGLQGLRPLDGTVDRDLLKLEVGGKQGSRPTLLFSSIAVALAAGVVSCLLVLAVWSFLT